ELNEDDVPAAVEERLRSIQEPVRPREEPEPKAGRLSIDDILLSMSEKGKQTAAQARAQREAAEAAAAAQEAEAARETASEAETVPVAETAPVAEAASGAENTPAADAAADTENAPAAETVSDTENVPAAETVSGVENAPVAEIGAEEAVTLRTETASAENSVPAEPAFSTDTARKENSASADMTANDTTAAGRSIAAAATEELTEKQLEAIRYSNHPEKLLKNRNSLPSYSEDTDLSMTRRIVNTKEELQAAARKELLATRTIRIPTEEVAEIYSHNTEGIQDTTEAPFEGAAAPAKETPESIEASLRESSDALSEESRMDTGASPAENTSGTPIPDDDVSESAAHTAEDEDDSEEYYDDPLTIEPHLRGLFKGFTEIDGLEDQIANAILQTMAKGDDRTSRTGNLLIFGPHGSGKTTLATGIAKAVAQEKGMKTAKMARIYASDLNRRDIAATIARIAGGTLIVEEAGDLDDNTVDQMTTAMEFRTDGLIVILEDEQRYVHDLLMKHPRFTMKFTAQIYLPVYTAEELSMFAQQHANELDYMISEDGFEVIRQKVAEAAPTETPMSVADVIALVDQAIRHSNKFMRKMSMGKKRYDENDYVLLFAKDFK
ncbi:MAG: hypothetical protein LUH53_08780, partial [Lachnospiraceae bacterium]|nr:hypothetical protein [Lachnospiraceae bacterium]